MKFLKIASIIAILIFSSTGCDQNNKIEDKPQTTISDNNSENRKDDIQILDVNVDLKKQDKTSDNRISYLQEEVKGGLDAGTKKSFNIDLRKGESLRIDTEAENPITIMLKNNSTGEYVYNDTQIPKDSSILIDSVDKDGNYELIVDFDKTETFSFKVYIVNK